MGHASVQNAAKLSERLSLGMQKSSYGIHIVTVKKEIKMAKMLHYSTNRYLMSLQQLVFEACRIFGQEWYKIIRVKKTPRGSSTVAIASKKAANRI